MFELIGLCLSLTVFFVLHLLLSVASNVVWKFCREHRFASATVRAQVIFLFRISPLLLSSLAVVLLLLPAYLINEPRQNTETINLPLGLLALASVYGLSFALWRVLAAILATRQLVRRWKEKAQDIHVSGLNAPVFRLTNDFPVIAIVGIFRPQIFIADQLFSVLDPNELAATIAHEHGHLFAHDNRKRVWLRLSQDLLLKIPCGKILEADWNQASESAADEFAARTGKTAALDLASALVKIARTIPSGITLRFPLGAGILGEDAAGITGRVKSLLELADTGLPAATPFLSKKTLFVLAFSGSGTVLYCLLNAASILTHIHEIAEIIVAGLQ